MKSPRQVAAEALLRVDRGGYSQLVLDAAIKKARLEPQDAAFAAALFYTALERRLTLDFCIEKYARHALTDTIRAVLRLSVAQLLYFDSVPARAAVDEAVKLSRAMGQSSAAGMVNAILRSFLRDGCRLPPVEGDDSARLSVEYSCAPWLVERLVGWHGRQAAGEILAASLGRPPLFVRVNPLVTDAAALTDALDRQGCRVVSTRLDGNCLEVAGDPVRTKAHRLGWFHVQDLCSQQAALTVGALPGERILDACAAPGSKSFVMAQQMRNTGEILACDIAPKRLALIERGANRLGLTILRPQQQDAAVKNEALGAFDRVLCDLPCSGLGVLRRKPEIKYRAQSALDGLPELQYKILKTSSHYLKAGGMLVYSTCTVNPEENEGVVNRFLAENPGFSPDAPAGGRSRTILPDAGGGDGFFIARIRRNP
jgi:16S rRNA (cytosine967-C5)-methyltransferase